MTANHRKPTCSLTRYAGFLNPPSPDSGILQDIGIVAVPSPEMTKEKMTVEGGALAKGHEI